MPHGLQQMAEVNRKPETELLPRVQIDIENPGITVTRPMATRTKTLKQNESHASKHNHMPRIVVTIADRCVRELIDGW